MGYRFLQQTSRVHTSLEVGLLVIVEGLQIELDLEGVIRLIKEGTPTHFPHKNLNADCKQLLTRHECPIGHTLREGNRIVDRLANMRVEQHVDEREPPTEETKVKRSLIVEIEGALKRDA